MTKDGIPKRRRQDEARRKKRLQAAAAWPKASNSTPKAIQVPSAAPRPSVGLPPMTYPIKRATLGKRQAPGGSL